MTSAHGRACAVCGADLAGRRPQTRYCAAACRAEASRLRRLLAGESVDGFTSLADRLARRHARAVRFLEASDADAADAAAERRS